MEAQNANEKEQNTQLLIFYDLLKQQDYDDN